MAEKEFLIGSTVRHGITGDRWHVVDTPKGPQFRRDVPGQEILVPMSRKRDFQLESLVARLQESQKAQIAHAAVCEYRDTVPGSAKSKRWLDLGAAERADWIEGKPELEDAERRLYAAVMVALEEPWETNSGYRGPVQKKTPRTPK